MNNNRRKTKDVHVAMQNQPATSTQLVSKYGTDRCTGKNLYCHICKSAMERTSNFYGGWELKVHPDSKTEIVE